MTIRDMNKLSGLLRLMEEVEISAAQLYEQCAVSYPSDQTFWNHLVLDEKEHADKIASVIDTVMLAPDEFELGRPFTEAGIRTIIKYVDSITEKVKDDTITYKQLLFTARDIEHSILESDFVDIVKTNNAEKLALLERIRDDTHRHRASLDEKIRQQK